VTCPKTYRWLVAELGFELRAQCGTCSFQSYRWKISDFFNLLRFSLYIGIFANALWTCENLIQKIQIFLMYLVDGLLFALLIAPYVFYYFLSTRSTCLIPNATFKLPPILYLIRVPGTAVLLGAVPCGNATPAG